MPTPADPGAGRSAPAAGTTSAGLSALYQERILDHYRRPRHKGVLERATGVHGARNPLCGDDITVSVRMTDGVVAEARYAGTGCSIMQATASMLLQLVQGRSRVEIDELLTHFDGMLASGRPDDALGELAALAGVAGFPARHKCARLAWKALYGAMDESDRR